MKKVIIDPKRETTPNHYKEFKGVSKQAINNWLYRDKKLLYRKIPAFNLILIQIPEHELEAWQKHLSDK